ncbi:MAG: hypothetical protein J7498_05470 [Sphingobium sp.]|nr:hypothetical protein [Sphingobium sp.]
MIPVSQGNTGNDQQFTDENDGETFTGDTKSSATVLTALKRAEDTFRDWQATCSTIDEIYNLDGAGYGGIRSDLDQYGWRDTKLDLFWASYEVLKPAVYARPPQPVVEPLFKDTKRLPIVTAELLERCAVSTLKRTGIGDVMTEVRDDLIFTSRGIIWITYEADNDGKRVCFEHLDRKDFLHEPVRKWQECGWVGRRAWMTRKEMRKRFFKTSGDAYQYANYLKAKDRDGDLADEDRATTKKAGVWEVWHKADGKVYWVTPGVDVLLDSGEPHLKLCEFFPCPRPAFATKRHRSMIPVPDWERYAVHFRKISDLTGRIYQLLNQVRMMGIIAGGGDVADAVEDMLRAIDDDQTVIRVNSIQPLNETLSWLPLKEMAEAIQGLIMARGQLIEDFYQLSGISDIMRGASEENETLGAQQLKTQFGSVRVREKSAELQRLAADGVKIACEIIAEKFDQETLLEMSQMDLPTKREIEKHIKEIEEAAKGELKALGEKAKQAAAQSQQQIDPQQAEQALQQAQQQIVAKYAPMLSEAQNQVPIEDVIKLLRDDRARNFTFEIESSSTILVDELEEKRARNEFMDSLSKGIPAMLQLVALGEPAAKLAGEALKFQLAPYRAGRSLDGAIDQFIDAAPEMAKAMAAKNGANDEAEGLVEAQKQLAQAEMEKGQAAMANVQAKAALDKAELQRKMMQMQLDAQNDAVKAQQEAEKLRLQMADMAEKHGQAQRKLEADIDKVRAETVQILQSIGLAQRQQEMAEFKSVADVSLRQGDQSLSAQGQAQEAQFRDRQSQQQEAR